ncbi:hypothetical protein FAIPA1_10578 [Frankia sp. AiPs1]
MSGYLGFIPAIRFISANHRVAAWHDSYRCFFGRPWLVGGGPAKILRVPPVPPPKPPQTWCRPRTHPQWYSVWIYIGISWS